MHLTTQEVSVENLKLGMYVSRLDIPWVQTPFPIQGFALSTQEELNLLSHYCNKVYIDIFLSKNYVADELQKTSKPSQKADEQLDPKTIKLMNEKARFKPRVKNYTSSIKLNKEMKNAEQLYQQVSAQMASIYKDLEQNGYLNLSEIRNASTAMTKSVINNPNALAWLCRINSDNKTLHQQSVRSAVWALIFARHLGLSKDDLNDVGTALLLSPIGKSKLDEDLLTQQNSSKEIEQYQKHVQLTLEETEKMFSASHQVSYILAAYCERHNGKGYPRKLVGNKIPFLARIAGIADYYEQMINPYDPSKALTPAETISHIYNLRGDFFQKELVEKFIQSIGLYPTGSLVSLSDSSTGVVLEQPEKSRLRPKVAVIKDSMDILIDKPKTVNLADDPQDEYGLTLQINKSLKSTSNDIDAHDIHNKVFAKGNWFSFLKA